MQASDKNALECGCSLRSQNRHVALCLAGVRRAAEARRMAKVLAQTVYKYVWFSFGQMHSYGISAVVAGPREKDKERS